MDKSDKVFYIFAAVVMTFVLGVVVGAFAQDKERTSTASYCSTCNKIYFDERNRCDECGTEYIKYKGEKK